MAMTSKKDWPWFSQAECKPIESTSLVSPNEVSVIQRSRRQAGGGPAGEEPDKSGSIRTKPTNQDSSIEPVEEDQHAADGGAEEEVGEDGDAPPPPEPHPEQRRPRGEQRVRPMPRPVTPTPLERENHELTHLPFAPWCRFCVLARSQSDPHRRTRKHKGDATVPVVSFDFCFARRSDQDKADPIIVMRDHQTRMTFAHMLPGKSTVNELYSRHVLNSVLRDLEYLAHKKVVLKSDQEPAMIALQNRIRQARDDQTILENSPVEDSASNGAVEKAVQEVEGHVRTLVAAVEARYGSKLDTGSGILAWLVAYSAYLINHFREGRDGHTPIERLKGERVERTLAEFGECVYYLPLD